MKNKRAGKTNRPATKYMAFNELSGKYEEVFRESEIPDSVMVIPMFWCYRRGKVSGCYVTVPGTEFYGPVPA